MRGKEASHRRHGSARQRWASAVLVACAVHWTHSAFDPVLQYGLVLTSFVGTRVVDWGDDPLARRLAIVKIDRERFLRIYGGTSPLPRCRLRDDLSKLAAIGTLKTIAVDFDLSPTWRTDGEEASCQRQIDSLIDCNADRFVLIRPLDEQGGPAAEWYERRRHHGVVFGHPVVDTERGMTKQYPVQDEYRLSAFGETIRRHMHEQQGRPPRDAGCARMQPPPEGVESRDADVSEHTRPIAAFRLLTLFDRGRDQLFDRGKEQDLAGVALGFAALGAEGPSAVVFGAGYTRDDEFLAPIGPLHGVDLHAAIAAREPASAPQSLAFALEVLVGYAFAMWFHVGWKRYFGDRDRTDPVTRDLAFNWLVMGFLVGVPLWLLLALPCAAAFALGGLLINPGAMGIGMAIDSTLVAAISTSPHWRHYPEVGADGKRPIVTTIRRLRSMRWSQWLRVALFLAVVVPTVLDVIREDGWFDPSSHRQE